MTKMREYLAGPDVHSSEGMDEFLNDATLLLHLLWTYRGGRRLSIEALHDLNDLLTSYFGTRE